MELTVTVYNINWGQNPELMETCRLLGEYARYVEQVRIFARTKPFPEAVKRAVDYCIHNGVLSEFLSKNRAEAVEMCIFEFDEEKYLKMERDYAYQNGLDEGQKIGRREGENQILKLLKILTESGRSEEINSILTDQVYREQLYKEYNLQ